PVALMPLNEITTAFFVTPVSIDQNPDVRNDYRARIDFVSTERGDLYDRDENLISGTVPQDIVCVGRINAKDLLSAGTAARLENGGWGLLWSYRLLNQGGSWVPAAFDRNGSTADALHKASSIVNSANKRDKNAPDDDGAVVIKLEYNTGGTFNGESVGGTYNNAIMIHPDKDNPFLFLQ
ncbi:MAG: hypothetical protein ACUVT0_03485, partial [Thermochromatium sp.]